MDLLLDLVMQSEYLVLSKSIKPKRLFHSEPLQIKRELLKQAQRSSQRAQYGTWSTVTSAVSI